MLDDRMTHSNVGDLKTITCQTVTPVEFYLAARETSAAAAAERAGKRLTKMLTVKQDFN
jgi:hypothetical protein